MFRKQSTALRLSRVWADDDMDELRVAVEGPDTGFAVTAYVGPEHFKTALDGLRSFAKQSYGGVYDLRFGEFGTEYASGAIHVRFHWVDGRIYLTCRLQAEFARFAGKEVADEALIHARTEPAMFDTFLAGLGFLVARASAEVVLELVPVAG